jgi:hypothetical protein
MRIAVPALSRKLLRFWLVRVTLKKSKVLRYLDLGICDRSLDKWIKSSLIGKRFKIGV